MKFSRIFTWVILTISCIIIDGCNPMDVFSPKKPKIKGRILTYRSRVPIAGASIKTYKTFFNCGFGCSTRKQVDSSGTNSNGEFSFEVSEKDLELYVHKTGYFGIYPGEGIINQRTGLGVTDYGLIIIKPRSTILVTFVNSVSNRDSITYNFYACGDLVNTGISSPFQLNRDFTTQWDVEGNCTIDIHTTVYRKGAKIMLKDTVYAPQYRTVRKTIYY